VQRKSVFRAHAGSERVFCSDIFVEVVVLKKLYAVMLFVFVASLFAAGAGFAATSQVVSADYSSTTTSGPDSFGRVTSNLVVGAPRVGADQIPDNFNRNTSTVAAGAAHQAVSNNVLYSMATAGQIRGNASLFLASMSDDFAAVVSLDTWAVSNNLAVVSDTIAKSLRSGIFSAPARLDQEALQLHVVFSADVDGTTDVNAGVGLALFQLEREFYGKRADELRGVKALTATSATAFETVFSSMALDDKKAAVVERTMTVGGVTLDRVMAADERVGQNINASYFIGLAVQAGKAWDASLYNGVVVDPSFAIASNPLYPHFVPAIGSLPTTTVPIKLDAVKTQLQGTVDPEGKIARVTERKWTNFRYVKESIITGFGYALADVQQIPAYQLLVGSTQVDDPRVVLFYLDDVKFKGLAVSQIGVSGAYVNSATDIEERKFTLAETAAGLVDGTYAILKNDSPATDRQKVMAATETIEEGTTYYVAIAVRRQQNFDLRHDDSSLIYVPAFITKFGSAPAAPKLVLTPSGSTTLEPGDTVDLVVTVSDGSAVPVVTWDSSDAAIASFVVSGDTCVVTAEAVGTANITCVPEVGSGIDAATPVAITVAQNTPSGGDSSSGCSVGGFAPATLLLLAPLFLLLKK